MSEQKEIIITGVNGFVGEHLARYLSESHIGVIGVGREDSPAKNASPLLNRYIKVDFLDSEQVASLDLTNVTAIIHLAGLASVAESFDKPELYKTGNAQMIENLLKTASDQQFKGRVVAISTGALYAPTQPMPLNEDSYTTEGSPYATGKLRAEDVIKKYIELGIDAVIVRPFNHIGPGQGPGFLVGDLYDQLQTAHNSNSSEILVGNLSTKRDYTDVRDIVKAYALLACAPSLQHDTYNVSSGKSYSGLEILEYLKDEMGLKSIQTSIDQSRVRPTDAQDIIGDASRLKQELGWTIESDPVIAIRDFVARRKS